MMLKLLAALMAVVLLAGVVLAADPKLSDGAINDNVRIKLSADAEVKGGGLKVEVVQGVVTITGFADTQRQIDKATKIAKKVKGVKQVINKMSLKEKTASR